MTWHLKFCAKIAGWIGRVEVSIINWQLHISYSICWELLEIQGFIVVLLLNFPHFLLHILLPDQIAFTLFNLRTWFLLSEDIRLCVNNRRPSILRKCLSILQPVLPFHLPEQYSSVPLGNTRQILIAWPHYLVNNIFFSLVHELSWVQISPHYSLN